MSSHIYVEVIHSRLLRQGCVTLAMVTKSASVNVPGVAEGNDGLNPLIVPKRRALSAVRGR